MFVAISIKAGQTTRTNEISDRVAEAFGISKLIRKADPWNDTAHISRQWQMEV